MAIAGRVAPIPKGEWNSAVEYTKLDIVSYNNKSFMAKTTSQNHTPVGDSQDLYWMLLVEGVTDAFTGATASSDGTSGVVPAPLTGEQKKVLKGDGTWSSVNIDEVVPTTGATAGQIPILEEVGGTLKFAVTDIPSSGHTIKNMNGTDMTQRASMQFADAGVTDDSTNDKTVVKVVRQMTQAQYESLSASEKAGVIEITNATNPYLYASQVRTAGGSNVEDELDYIEQIASNNGMLDEGNPYTFTMPNGTTYLHIYPFNLGANVKKAFITIHETGTVDVWHELFKGVAIMTSQLGSEIEAQVGWTDNGSIHIAYTVNKKGADASCVAKLKYII